MAEKRTEVNRSSEQIARDLEQTRGRISHTLEELEKRVAPRKLMNDAIDNIKDSVGRSKVIDTIRENPIPSILAAVGLAGTAWLIAEGASHKEPRAERAGEPLVPEKPLAAATATGTSVETFEAGTVPPDVEGLGETVQEGLVVREERREDWPREVHEPKEGLKEKASRAKEAVKDKAAGMKEKAGEAIGRTREKLDAAGRTAGDKLQDARHRAGDKASDAADMARQKARQTRDWTVTTFEEHPLSVAAVVAAAGVLVGLALPRSRREDRMMGQARDRVLGNLKQSGRDMMGKASHAASAAVEAGTEEARKQGMGGSQLMEKAQSVVAAATQAGSEEARKEGLTPEQIAEQAKESISQGRPQGPPRQGEQVAESPVTGAEQPTHEEIQSAAVTEGEGRTPISSAGQRELEEAVGENKAQLPGWRDQQLAPQDQPAIEHEMQPPAQTGKPELVSEEDAAKLQEAQEQQRRESIEELSRERSSEDKILDRKDEGPRREAA